jgi:regulator of nucleoside diphosphate kinase
MSMELDQRCERTLTELDHARLARLTRSAAAPARQSDDDDALVQALEDADLVAPSAVAADVVTMRSKVLLRDLETSRRHRLTLCYPNEAEPAAGWISVLSPVGASLLGLRVGDEARWTLPSGEQGAARVEAILFQPESSGDYTL